MTSKPVEQLLIDLGVTRCHSRPSVSNDNPYSECQFKTLKYCPAFPAGSARSPMPGRSARRSSITTSTSTATSASGCTPQHPFTTAPPPRSAPHAPTPSPLPTTRTLPDSATATHATEASRGRLDQRRGGRPTFQGQSLQSVARVGRYRMATAPDRNS